MREIKFRAWLPKGAPVYAGRDAKGKNFDQTGYDNNRRMVEVIEISNKYDGTPHTIIFSDDDGLFHFCKVREPDFIIMQYTGLKDVDGVEIYDGDIVQRYQPYECKLVKLRGGKDRSSNTSWYKYLKPFIVDITNLNFNPNSKTRQFKVVGNIYQNPELLA